MIKHRVILLDLVATENGLLDATSYRAQVAIANFGAPPMDLPISKEDYEWLKSRKGSATRLELTIQQVEIPTVRAEGEAEPAK